MGKRLSRPVRASLLNRASKPLLQGLEKRLLFATINVNDYTTPNDGQDDLIGIQNAVNASSPGDTILFPGGVYNIISFSAQQHNSNGNGFIVPGDRKYVGQNGATLSGSDTKGTLLQIQTYNGNSASSSKVPTNNVTISHLTFNGGGLYVDSISGMNQNFLIDYNVFNLNMPAGCDNRNGITNTSGWQSTRITNNYFTGYNCSFAMYGYNYNGLTIANNEFVDVNAAMHIDAFPNSGHLLVEQNYIKGVHGMGMEFQSSATDLTFQDNWYEHPNLSSVKDKNNDSMAYSLILDKSSNITIRRNVVITDPNTERPDGIGTRIGFEVGGDNTLVEDNYIDGINHSLAMNDGVGTASVTAQNNRFMHFLESPRMLNPPSTATRWFLDINNGPNTILSATMTARIAAMQKPGIGAKRYGDAPPDNPPDNAPAPPANLNAVITGAGEVTLTWFDGSTDEDGFQVQMLQSDGVTWQTIAFAGVDSTSCVVSNVVDQERLRVVAYNLAGNSSPTNTITVVALPGAPTNLGGLAVGMSRIDLTWTDTSINESDFQVQLLSPDGLSWMTVGTVAADATAFSMNNVAAGQSYTFRVVAHNPNGYSPASFSTTVRTPMPDIAAGVTSIRRTRPALIYQGPSSTAVAPPMVTGA